MFEEFASGGVEHQKSFWSTHMCQCLTEVCKAIHLCRLHSFAESCETNWFSRVSNGFGCGNVVSDMFVKWLSSSEEHKWGRCMGAGAMGDGLVGRKDRRRQQQRVLRLNHHPWRRCLRLNHHPWRSASLKSSRWGVAWKQGGTGAGDESIAAAGLGGRL
jgi:hypothetical protein